MKAIHWFLLLSFIILASSLASSQGKKKEKKLEDKLKTYYIVFLKKGPTRDQDSVTAAKIQEAHLANINKLFNEKKLDIAGPFLDDGDMLGIFILNVASMEEAQRITNTDPAVKAGRLVMEIHPWMSAPGAKLR